MSDKRPSPGVAAPVVLEDVDLDVAGSGDGVADSIWVDIGLPTITAPASTASLSGKYVLRDYEFTKPESD